MCGYLITVFSCIFSHHDLCSCIFFISCIFSPHHVFFPCIFSRHVFEHVFSSCFRVYFLITFPFVFAYISQNFLSGLKDPDWFCQGLPHESKFWNSLPALACALHALVITVWMTPIRRYWSSISWATENFIIEDELRLEIKYKFNYLSNF